MSKKQSILILTLTSILAAGGVGYALWQSRYAVPSSTSAPQPVVKQAIPLHPAVEALLHPSADTPYLKLYFSIKKLPTNLGESDIRALLDYITGPQPENFTIGQWGSFTNDIQENLTVQSTPSVRVADTLIATFRDKEKTQLLRDYALQHIGGFAIYLVYQGQSNHAVFPSLVDELIRAAGDVTQPWSGTSLNLLDGVLRSAEAKATELAQLDASKLCALAENILAAPAAPLNASLPALQVAARRGSSAALEHARKALNDTQCHLMLAQSACSVLGLMGQSSDIPKLKKIEAQNLHLQPASKEAIALIESRLTASK